MIGDTLYFLATALVVMLSITAYVTAFWLLANFLNWLGNH